MKHTSRLNTWQLALIALGSLLIATPIIWDVLTSVFVSLADIRLEDVFTRGGMFVVGVVLLSIVGVAEIIRDFRDRPDSKYIR